MKNKKQQIIYIDNHQCNTINDYYLKDGQYHSIATKNQIATHVLLEKEDGIEEALNQIGITTHNSDGTIKTINEVLEEIAEVWRYL